VLNSLEVKYDNWNMGCNDLQFLGSYFRSILDRRGWSEGRKRKVIIDVGANTGDDTVSITKTFHPILQMCQSWSTPIQLVSIEPSPKVFCEMNEMVKTKLTEEDRRNIIRLNVALSDKTGHLIFNDPGHEGGSLVGSNFTDLPKMMPDEYSLYSQCKYTETEFKHMTVDSTRQSIVPTYTLDLLVSSLEDPAIGTVVQDQEIFVVKIDAEGELCVEDLNRFDFHCLTLFSGISWLGHDFNVLLGAKDLLFNKRISFIIFEVWTNERIKLVTQHMAQYDYQCFLLSKDVLVPVHVDDWWYPHMDNFTQMGGSGGRWWGNGLCGVKGSDSMLMLWRMYHSDNSKLLNSYLSL
jgi:FkbM family methyltransferase